MLQSRKDSLKDGGVSIPQYRKESLKDNSPHAPQFTGTSPPRRKDSDRLPSLPIQGNDGYEAVQLPQWSKSKPAPTKRAEHSSPDSGGPPPRPHKPSELSNTPGIDDSAPKQTVPPVRSTRSSSSSSVSPYETVEIVPPKREGLDGGGSEHKPPRPPKPGNDTASDLDDSSSIYMQPPAPVSVISPRDDVYDNVHIKNIPLAARGGPSTILGTSTGETKESGVTENDIASSRSQEVKGDKTSATEGETTDGSLEIDSGGMGCKNITKAMEERRQVLKETETKEGVVLLSMQKLHEKGSDLIQPYGMCLLTCATLHPRHSLISCSFIGPL